MKYIIVGIAVSTLLMACAKNEPADIAEKVQRLIAQQEYAEAEIVAKSALSDAPDDKKLREFLGAIFTRQGNYIEGFHQFSRADTSQLSKTSLLDYYEAAYFTGNIASVLEVREESLEPPAVMSDFFAALTLARIEQTSALLTQIASFKDSPEQDPKIVALAQAAIAYFEDRDMAQFTKQIQNTVEGNELANNWFILTVLANNTYLVQDYEQASVYFKQLTELRPFYLEPNLYLAESYVNSGDIAAAETKAKQILSAFPNQPVANQVMGLAALEQQNWNSAKEYLEKSIAYGYDSNKNYLLAGATNFILEKYEQAITQLEKGLTGIKQDNLYFDMLLQAKAHSQNPDSVLNHISQADLNLLSNPRQIKHIADVLTSSGAYKTLASLFDDLGQESGLNAFQIKVLEAYYAPSGSNVVDDLKVELSKPELQSSSSEAYLNTAQQLVIRDFYRNDDYQGALAQARKWYDEAPTQKRNRLILADALQMNQQYAEALSILSESAEMIADPHFHMLRTKSFYYLERWDEALESATTALSMSPYNINFLRQYAYVKKTLAHTAESDETITGIYASALDKEADAILLSMYYAMMDEPTKALASLNTFEQPSKASIVFHYTKAETLLLNQQADAAKQLLLQATQKLDVPVAALGNVIQSLLKMSEPTRAVAILERHLLLKPLSYDARVMHVRALMAKGDYEQAMQSLRKLAASPDVIASIESDILLSQGKLKSGLAKLQESFARSNSLKQGLKLATTYVQLSDNAAAQLVLDQLAEHKNNPHVKLLQAEIVPPQEAIALYQQILDDDPNFVGAMNNLAFLYYQQNDLGRALPLAERAASMAPSNVHIQETLSKIKQAQSE